MIICCKCSRPANVKVVERDDYGRAIDKYYCDDHHEEKNSRRAYMEKFK